jgi:hypothetical protein
VPIQAALLAWAQLFFSTKEMYCTSAAPSALIVVSSSYPDLTVGPTLCRLFEALRNAASLELRKNQDLCPYGM